MCEVSGSRRREVLRPAVGCDPIRMTFDHIGKLLVRLQPLPFEAGAPVLEGLPRPCLAVVIQQLSEALLEQVGGIEPLIRGHGLLVGLDAFGIQQALLDQLDASGLHSEVGYREREGVLAQIAVLGDQVAGVAGEGQIFDFALRALGQADHFADVSKMIRHWLSGLLAGRFGLLNYCATEISPFGVTQVTHDVELADQDGRL